MITAIKVFALFLSLMGYILHLRKKGLPTAFAPVFLVSSIGIVMFFAGLLNVMPWVAKLVFITGIFLLGLSLYKSSPRNILQHDLIAVISYFSLLYLFMFLRLRNSQITAYDNFSHWLLVIREILRVDRLPNFISTLIEFQAYPTGTAGFVYFVCQIIGDTEGCILFAQSIILISCLCVFWAFVKRNHALSCLLIVAASLYLLVYNISISDLSVDTILSLLSISSFAALVYYRKELDKASILMGVIGCFLMLVKNSGIFYVLTHGSLLMLVYLYDLTKKQLCFTWKQPLSLACYSTAAPLITFLLWNQHVKYAFYAGDTSKHSMSVENYTTVFGDKSAAQIREILDIFISRLANPEREGTVLLILLLLYAGFFIFFKAAKSGLSYRPPIFFGWSLFSYICYVIGIGVMYLVSMPYNEAIMLGSFGRYLATQTMYMMGIAVIYLLTEVSASKKLFSFTSVFASIIVCLFLSTAWTRLTNLLPDRTDYSETKRGILQTLHYEHNIPYGERYYIVGPWEYGYLDYVSKYEFWSRDAIVRESPDPEEFPDFFNSFDYLIIVTETDGTQAFLSALGLPSGQAVYKLADYR